MDEVTWPGGSAGILVWQRLCRDVTNKTLNTVCELPWKSAVSSLLAILQLMQILVIEKEKETLRMRLSCMSSAANSSGTWALLQTDNFIQSAGNHPSYCLTCQIPLRNLANVNSTKVCSTFLNPLKTYDFSVRQLCSAPILVTMPGVLSYHSKKPQVIHFSRQELLLFKSYPATSKLS